MPQPPLPTFAGPPRQPLRSSSSNPDRSTTIGDIGPTSAALLASGLLEFRQAGCRFRRLDRWLDSRFEGAVRGHLHSLRRNRGACSRGGSNQSQAVTCAADAFE